MTQDEINVAAKELRNKTGWGMMDCKKAISETNGDLVLAEAWLENRKMYTFVNWRKE